MKKLVVFFSGLLLILIIFEMILRLIGYIHMKHIYMEKLKNQNGYFSIYCYGDSFTRGMGAPEGKDYPTQLKEFFKNNSLRKINVINRGVSGSNSSQILERINNDIKNNRPDLIIVLSGAANLWNSWGYESGFNKFLNNIKIYKFFKIITFNIQNKKLLLKGDIALPELENEKFQSSINKFKKGIISNPKDANNYYLMGIYYAYSKDIENADKWFEKGIKVNKYEGSNYYGIIKTFFLLPETSQKGIYTWLNSEYLKDTTNYHLITSLAWINKVKRNYLLSNKYYSKAKYLDSTGYVKKNNYIFTFTKTNYFDQPLNQFESDIKEKIKFNDIKIDEWVDIPQYKNTVDQDLLYNKYKDIVLPWAKNDIKEMIDICKKNKIKLILLDYPLHGRLTYYELIAKEINDITKNLAIKNDVIFVNNNNFLNTLGINKFHYFEPLKNGDHPNEKGYHIMAGNIYKVIRKNDLLEYK